MIAARTHIPREAVAAHYDDLDHFYRDVWGEHVHHGLWIRGNERHAQAVEQLVELVARQGQIGPGTRVCDIGCGYGATARWLAGRNADVTAMTISPAQFTFAEKQRNAVANLRFVLGDWLENDLPAESFDTAIAIESSEHMPNLEKFFVQAHRVLRPEGCLVICAWLAAERSTAAAAKWLLEPICREGRMPQMGTASDYQTLGERAGFRFLEMQDVTKGVAPTWPAIVRRLLAKLVSDPRYLRFLVSRHAPNRIFALTILRIWIAYRIGAMRYGVFTFRR